MSEWKVLRNSVGTYIFGWWYITPVGENHLWHDGHVHPTTCNGEEDFKSEGYWRTKEEAEPFLENYLMSDVKTKLEQAKKDRKDVMDKMDKTIQELEQELKKSYWPYLEAGQIFNITLDAAGYRGMVHCLAGKYSLTSMGSYIGSWFSPFKRLMDKKEFTDTLMRCDAKYVGKFHDLFEEKA